MLLAVLAFQASAQTDSLQLNIKQAEALFLKQNYDLIAAGFQIDQAKAEIITARLFDNPELNYENLFYNHETKKFFQTSYADGQYAASISQLFKLAGKRNKNIKLAQIGSKLAEISYFDLMRSLKFALNSTFYEACFTAQSLNIYQSQIAATTRLLKEYELQQKAGNIAIKDVIRIKSLLLNLKAEWNDTLNNLEDKYRDLKILCGLNAATPLKLVFSQPDGQTNIEALPYQSLLDSARTNRADLKLSQANLEYQTMNLKLQKAMAIPDVELSLSYDYKGNYPEKYTGLGIKIPIPLFNRNQGEIKKATIGISAAENTIKQQELQLENEVFNTYKTLVRNEQLVKDTDPDFGSSFDKLIEGLIKNFRLRNISLIEFLDLFDSYKENTLRLNKLQLDKMNARAEMNYVTGTTIFK